MSQTYCAFLSLSLQEDNKRRYFLRNERGGRGGAGERGDGVSRAAAAGDNLIFSPPPNYEV